MTTRGRLSLARRTLSSFWRLWGTAMSLLSCMIEILLYNVDYIRDFLFNLQFSTRLSIISV